MASFKLSLFIQAARRIRRHRSGSAAVEFALIAPMFFTLLFASFEIGLAFLAEQTLETATHDAARMIFTGEVQTGKLDADGFKNEICKRIPTLLTCAGIVVDVRPLAEISPNPIVGGKFTLTTAFNPGTSGQTVRVMVYYEWPLLVTSLGFDYSNIIGGKRLLVSTFGFRNEPYEGS
jgi:Flp pilus assembly protein TadG